MPMTPGTQDLIVRSRAEAEGGRSVLAGWTPRRGPSDLPLAATHTWLKAAFDEALLHWGRGDIASARSAFESCIEAHERRVALRRKLSADPLARRVFARLQQLDRVWAEIAARLIDAPLSWLDADVEPDWRSGPGCEPWLREKVTGACLDSVRIDVGVFEGGPRNRARPYLRDLWRFYAEVLAGGWARRPASDMLETHARCYALRRAARVSDIRTGDGVFNPIVPDVTFALVLKTIGWTAPNRHAWPVYASVRRAPVERAVQGEHRDFRLEPLSGLG